MHKKHPNSPNINLKLGLCLFYQGFNEAAEEYLKSALGGMYNNVKAMCILGEIYYKKESWTQAIEYFEKSVTQEKTLIRGYYRLAEIHYKLYEFEKAVEYAEKGLRYNSENVDMLYILGNSYLQM